jgi:hypothetical protein
MGRRLAVAFVTAAMLAACAVAGQTIFAIWVECGYWTWPFC